jgi:hypothetical protein
LALRAKLSGLGVSFGGERGGGSLQARVDVVEQRAEVGDLEHMRGEVVDHGRLDGVAVQQHRRALVRARLDLGLAAVVVHLPALRAVPDEGGAAMPAAEQTGQQVLAAQPTR